MTRKSLACSAGERSPIRRETAFPIGLDEHAGAIAAGIGEGAALVTKQLAFEQGIRDGGAVHRHKGTFGARRVVVDGSRYQLLPVPDSPVISTFTDELAMRRIRLKTSCICGERPTMFSKR